MNTSPSIAKISPAILAAQRNIGGVVKDAQNPHFRSAFASLGACIAAVKFSLNEQGISLLQPIGRDESGDYVETVLLHESGEFIADKTRIVYAKQNDPQAAGSAQTYAKRYGLQSMMLLPTADDDAESAMYRDGNQPAPEPPPTPKKHPTSKPIQGDGVERWDCQVHSIEEKGATSKAGKAYTRYTINLNTQEGTKQVSTIDEYVADKAYSLKDNAEDTVAVVEKGQYGYKLLSFDSIG